MRQFAWYSPEFNVIVLQSFMEDCYIMFEWGNLDAYETLVRFGPEADPMELTHWCPLGEL